MKSVSVLTKEYLTRPGSDVSPPPFIPSAEPPIAAPILATWTFTHPDILMGNLEEAESEVELGNVILALGEVEEPGELDIILEDMIVHGKLVTWNRHSRG